MVKDKQVRIWGTIPGHVDEKLAYWAERLGVSKGTLISLAAQAGLSSIIRAIEPEKAFTSEEWAAILSQVGEVTGEKKQVQPISPDQVEKQVAEMHQMAQEIAKALAVGK